MAVDLEQMMLLFQRRFHCLKKIDELTDELQDAFVRHDEVSASLVLEMRAEEIAKLDDCIGQIWDLAGEGGRNLSEVRRLVETDPYSAPRTDCWEENKIFEVRRNTVQLLKRLQEKDRRMNLSAGGDKSYYYRKNQEK